ncbi:hypothetical protein CCR75_007253 [Bremia lactucae]|uniref:Uncharacterized protein n=1 Tax=Bremia lactucae TaxID=4779 RepID=A0A976FNS6_BRELC|nr:hypothetical protein CCR75_007253 [Bremia lactucae]
MESAAFFSARPTALETTLNEHLKNNVIPFLSPANNTLSSNNLKTVKTELLDSLKRFKEECEITKKKAGAHEDWAMNHVTQIRDDASIQKLFDTLVLAKSINSKSKYLKEVIRAVFEPKSHLDPENAQGWFKFSRDPKNTPEEAAEKLFTSSNLAMLTWFVTYKRIDRPNLYLATALLLPFGDSLKPMLDFAMKKGYSDLAGKIMNGLEHSIPDVVDFLLFSRELGNPIFSKKMEIAVAYAEQSGDEGLQSLVVKLRQLYENSLTKYIMWALDVDENDAMALKIQKWATVDKPSVPSTTLTNHASPVVVDLTPPNVEDPIPMLTEKTDTVSAQKKISKTIARCFPASKTRKVTTSTNLPSIEATKIENPTVKASHTDSVVEPETINHLKASHTDSVVEPETINHLKGTATDNPSIRESLEAIHKDSMVEPKTIDHLKGSAKENSLIRESPAMHSESEVKSHLPSVDDTIEIHADEISPHKPSPVRNGPESSRTSTHVVDPPSDGAVPPKSVLSTIRRWFSNFWAKLRSIFKKSDNVVNDDHKLRH